MMFMLGLGVILAIGLALFSFVDRKSIKTKIMNEVNAAMEGTRNIARTHQYINAAFYIIHAILNAAL